MAELLVGGQPVGHQPLQLAVGQRHRRIELHGGHRHLPCQLVVDAEDGAVDDRRVLVQHGLELGRCHLEPPDLDHLLHPVGEVHPTLGLEPPDVARAVPAVAERLRGLASGR